MPQFVETILSVPHATVVYFDDPDTAGDDCFQFGKPEAKRTEEELKTARMRLSDAHTGFYQALVMNKGSPWFAFHQATKTSCAEPLVPIGKNETLRCCLSANQLFDSAQNYFGIEGLPERKLTNHSKRFVEGKWLEGLSSPQELVVRNAILAQKHIVRGIVVVNKQPFPVDGAILNVEAFPVKATVAGPTADGSFGGGMPSWKAQH